MDIIDPALESSVERENIDEAKFKSLFWQIIVLIVIALIVWIIYSTYNSRLDTKPEESIDINPALQGPAAPGRQAPISETL
jgi:ABC-type amino acid transport system permease subunit